MSKEIPYRYQPGEYKKYNLKLHVLSTCGHCTRTLKFLREHSIEFSYVYVDLLDLETLRYVRDELRKKFNQNRIQYPFLVIDEDRFLAGFEEEKYKELFGIKARCEYIRMPGENKDHKIRLYALSTCGFCKKAIEFLRKYSIEYEYVFCDYLPREVADELNEDIINLCKDPSQNREEFMEQARFPFLVMDDKKCLGGFNEEKYKEFFNISITPETDELKKKELIMEEEKIQAKAISALKGQKSVEETKVFTEMVAKHQGWVLTRDKELLQILREGFATNWNRYGYFSCPCRLADGEREMDKDIICPCVYANPDIDEYGHCYCGLYLSKEFFASGKQPTSIPERRRE
ncbi:MAG: ferredoxin-thioredoxin reductase catalytic domain-containing protein [Promethearchaeota archaeon]